MSFADDDLWGSDSELAGSGTENDLWGTPAPAPKAVEKAPAAKPAAKNIEKPAAKPVAKPAEKPAEQPVVQPVAQPVTESVPEPIIRRGDPQPQQNDSAVTETAPVVLPVQEEVAAPVAAEPDSASTEFGAAMLSESTESVVDSNTVVDSLQTDSSRTDSVVTSVATVDSVAKDTVAAKPDSAAAAAVDGYALYDSLHANQKESLRFWGMGLVVDGSYGLFNQKLMSNSFMVPSAGAGITAMIGYSHFALRLEGLFKYERIYVSEEVGTVNEGFWRLGGGAFARFMSGLECGFVAEVGASIYSSLTNDIVLYDDQKTEWTLKSSTEIPLEVAVGYKIPVKPVSFEFAAFFDYELANSMNFAFGGDYKASAWHAGIRAVAWLF